VLHCDHQCISKKYDTKLIALLSHCDQEQKDSYPFTIAIKRFAKLDYCAISTRSFPGLVRNLKKLRVTFANKAMSQVSSQHKGVENSEGSQRSKQTESIKRATGFSGV